MEITILMLFTKIREYIPSVKVRIPSKFQSLPLNGIRLYSRDIIPDESHYLYICDPHDPDIDDRLAQRNPVLFIAPERPVVLSKKVLFFKSSVGTASVFNVLQQIWNQFLDWDRGIHEALLKDPSFQNLLNATTGFIEEPLLIYDKGLRLLAYCNPSTTDDSIFYEAISQGYLPPEITREFSKDRIFDPQTRSEPLLINPLYLGQHITMYQPFIQTEQIVGFCVMLCNNPSRIEYNKQLFSCFFPSASICMEHYLENRHASGQMEEYTIIHILETAEPDNEQIRSRMDLIDIPYESTFVLVSISFPEDAAAVRSYLINQLQMFLFGCTILEYKENILLLFYDRTQLDPLNYMQRLPALFSRFTADFQQYHLLCSVSLPFCNIGEIRSAYKQTQAVRLLISNTKGNRLYPDNGSFFFYTEEYLISYIRQTLFSDLGIRRICPVLDVIRQTEKDKYKFIRELILEYISHGFNVTDTAAALHMHRNNVIYHVKRLETKYGLDFQNITNIVKLYIDLAFELQ